MKILHIYKSYYPDTIGGVEKVIQSLAAATAKFGVENNLITTTKRTKPYVELIDNLEVYYYPKTFEYASCPISWQLAKTFKQHLDHADIIHYHFPYPFADLLHCLFAANKPSIVTYHSDIIKQKILNFFYTPLMNCFLNRMNYIIATSGNYLQSSPVLTKYLNKCKVIPIGISEQDYPTPTLEKLAQWKKIVGSDFLFFIGTLRYYKGLEYLLPAMQGSSATLVIAGTGPEEKRLKEKARLLNLNNIIFLGRIDEEDKTALYKLCKLIVMPSHLRSEAFCISLLEGLMFGKPLISTEIGTGSSFVNEHNVTGLIVEPKNPTALRSAIEKLLNNHDLCKKFSEAARKRYEKLFSADKMAHDYLTIYKKLMEN